MSGDDAPAGHLTRREALGTLAALPALAAGFSPAEVARAAATARAAQAAAGFTPAFFTPDEFTAVRILAELVIPRDPRSGGALDAGVPEFMDFILAADPGGTLATTIRGGLAWLDAEAGSRFGESFAATADTRRRAILDEIAWPARARPEHSQGVAFFNRFRDLTASGFFSSEIGVRDLQYLGNRMVAEWNGCPPDALAKLGLTP